MSEGKALEHLLSIGNPTTKFVTILLSKQSGENTMTWPIDRKVAGAFSVTLFSVGLLGALAYTSRQSS